MSKMKCPVCGAKDYIVFEDYVKYGCGCLTKVDGKTILVKCLEKVISFFRDNEYDPTFHYDDDYLTSVGVNVFGINSNFDIVHNNKVNALPFEVENNDYVKSGSDSKYSVIVLYIYNGVVSQDPNGKEYGIAITKGSFSNDKLDKLNKYIKEYNDIAIGNVWGFYVSKSDGSYYDMGAGGLIGDKEYMRDWAKKYKISDVGFEDAWNNRTK